MENHFTVEEIPLSFIQEFFAIFLSTVFLRSCPKFLGFFVRLLDLFQIFLKKFKYTGEAGFSWFIAKFVSKILWEIIHDDPTGIRPKVL